MQRDTTRLVNEEEVPRLFLVKCDFVSREENSVICSLFSLSLQHYVMYVFYAGWAHTPASSFRNKGHFGPSGRNCLGESPRDRKFFELSLILSEALNPPLEGWWPPSAFFLRSLMLTSLQKFWFYPFESPLTSFTAPSGWRRVDIS